MSTDTGASATPSATPSPSQGEGDRPGTAGSVRILAVGDRALLIDLDALDDVIGMQQRLVATAPAGIVDIVPAARTVLVTIDPSVIAVSSVRRWIGAAAASPLVTSDAVVIDPVVVRVHYDGADIDAVSETLGISRAELIRRHQEARWRVAFSGFTPGFGYLVSADWPFDVPRLASPRTRVPAGSVGLAGEFTGAYPRESPGGWQLIGHTNAVLWNTDAPAPALLVPGGTVRFEAEGAS